MYTLHLYGFMKYYGDGISLTDNNGRCIFDMIDELEKFGRQHGVFAYTDQDLGGYHIYLSKCNLRILASDKECTLEEAECALVDRLYGGSMAAELMNTGYSEYTILGMEIESMTIGGHNIKDELLSYSDKYIHFVLDLLE